MHSDWLQHVGMLETGCLSQSEVCNYSEGECVARSQTTTIFVFLVSKRLPSCFDSMVISATEHRIHFKGTKSSSTSKLLRETLSLMHFEWIASSLQSNEYMENVHFSPLYTNDPRKSARLEVQSKFFFTEHLLILLPDAVSWDSHIDKNCLFSSRVWRIFLWLVGQQRLICLELEVPQDLSAGVECPSGTCELLTSTNVPVHYYTITVMSSWTVPELLCTRALSVLPLWHLLCSGHEFAAMIRTLAFSCHW